MSSHIMGVSQRRRVAVLVGGPITGFVARFSHMVVSFFAVSGLTQSARLRVILQMRAWLSPLISASFEVLYPAACSD